MMHTHAQLMPVWGFGPGSLSHGPGYGCVPFASHSHMANWTQLIPVLDSLPLPLAPALLYLPLDLVI